MMTVFFDLDRTLMDFDVGEDMGISALYEACRGQLRMGAEEFRSTWKEVAQRTFDEYSAGLHTFDEQRRLRVRRMFSLNGIELGDAEADERFRLYWSSYERGVRLFPDARGILENLRERKIPTGLISNGDTSNQMWKLGRENLTRYFDPIVISGEVGVSKPEPRIFEIAMERAGATRGTTWYIGDSLVHDIEPAVKLGLNAIHLNRGLADGTVIRRAENPAYIEAASLSLAWECLEGRLGRG